MISNTLDIKEWQNVVLDGVELSDNAARETARMLEEKRIIEIEELKQGLSITSNSYVGRIRIGDLQINVYPKLNGMPLYRLLRYAYGLRELKLFNMADHDIDDFPFFYLFIYELYVEAEDLFRRGIQKSYIKREENLSSPRGKIDMNRLCNQGGVTNDTLPCKYFNREENNTLNQTLLAGLKLAVEVVIDTGLKIKLQRLCSILEESISDIKLTRAKLQLARNSMNRLTERYAAVLEIINILYESQGVQLENGAKNLSLKGYFFDMNAFFETLVGRLISDCSEDYSVKDQFSLHDMFIYTPGFNPNRRKSPTPRPDFALMKNKKVVKLLDAKYRDLWERSLPREMLYQLAIYAVSGIGNKTATILYPSINDIPSVQKIDINDPITSSKMASVILQPLNLIKIADLLSGNTNDLKLHINEVIA